MARARSQDPPSVVCADHRSGAPPLPARCRGIAQPVRLRHRRYRSRKRTQRRLQSGWYRSFHPPGKPSHLQAAGLNLSYPNDNTEAIRLRMSPDMPQFADVVEKYRCNQGKRVMNIRDLILGARPPLLLPPPLPQSHKTHTRRQEIRRLSHHLQPVKERCAPALHIVREHCPAPEWQAHLRRFHRPSSHGKTYFATR